MGIGSVCGDNSYYGYSAVTQNKSNDIYASASASIGDVSSNNEQDPLAYYKKLCGEYSDVTFRLDDMAEASKNPDKLTLGYNGSMNQIGNNFGGKGNCSISIDIAVIKRMQSDPQYEQSVKGLIEDSRRRYSEFEAGALQDGYQYVSVSIEDNNGKPQRGVVQTNYPYSTEDEVKSMWSSGEYSNRVVSIVDDIKSEAADIFFKMYDESRSDSVVKDTTTGVGNHEWEKNLKCQEAAESTTEDPVYDVTTTVNGVDITQKIHINSFKPTNATQAEMCAMFAYYDSINGTEGTYLEQIKMCQEVAKKIPAEIFDIDFHKFIKEDGDNEAHFIIEKTRDYIGGGASGNNNTVRKHNHEFKQVYKYYGVSQEDIDNKTDRFEEVVRMLALPVR